MGAVRQRCLAPDLRCRRVSSSLVDMDGQVTSPMKLLAPTILATLHGGIATKDGVETGHRVLDVLRPLLEEPVGVFLIVCGVLAAVALALYVGMLVAELQKVRQ